MSIVTYVLFGVAFGILVDKIEHILEVINTKITFTDVDVISANYEAPFYDEYLVRRCINWCHYFDINSQAIEGQGIEAKKKWTKQHIMDSWDEFWGGSLAAFLLGAYVIGCSIYIYNNLEFYIKS